MAHATFKKKLLPCLITMAITGIGYQTAYAAEGEEADKDAETVEIIGMRLTMKQNLAEKKDANSIVDIVNAEDVGKFPDKNVAESLSRITGVGVTREFGEGEKITVRGAGPDDNRTLLNGQTVGTADWFILDEPGRSFNYTLLPSVLVKGLELHKSPTASLDEGSIGATVILKTFRPFDLDSHASSVAIEGQYSETSGEWDPQLSGQYSWKNDAGTFGALVSVVKQDRTVQREGLEVLGWRADTGGNVMPTHIGVPVFIQERERETVFASLQLAPNDRLTMTLNLMQSEMDANNQNANWLVFPLNDSPEVVAGQAATSGGAIVASNDVTNGDVRVNYINRVSSSETNSYHLDIAYEGDGFSLQTQIGSTDAEGGTFRETSWEYGSNNTSTYSFDLRGTPNVVVNPGVNQASAFTFGWIWGGSKPTTDEEDYIQFDLTLPLENNGPFVALKTGVKLRDAERAQERVVYSWHGPDTVPANTPGGSYLGWVQNQCPTLATCGLDREGTINANTLSSGNLGTQLGQARSVMEAIAFNGLNGVNADYAVSMQLAENWSVEEDVKAFYVQADFEGDKYRGNLGVRYVDTAQTSGGYVFSGDSWGFLTIDRSWLTPAHLAWEEVDNDYSEFLPSFNIAFDLADDQILRFGAAKVMARQNYNDLAAYKAYGALNVASPTGTKGNPQLKPKIVDQFDLSWEWYFADTSLFAITYFHKDVQSYNLAEISIEQEFDQQNQVYVDVAYTQQTNGLGGDTDGVEVSLQKDFGGFGLQVNFTYTDANNNNKRSATVPGSGKVEGISDKMLNLTGYYENDVFGARLMYNYRSDWYKYVHWNGNELYNEAYGQWDASFNYILNDNVSFTLDAVNLTNEEIREYANDDKNLLMSLYENGRRFVVGARMTF